MLIDVLTLHENLVLTPSSKSPIQGAFTANDVPKVTRKFRSSTLDLN
jgi:hypothetical protein